MVPLHPESMRVLFEAKELIKTSSCGGENQCQHLQHAIMLASEMLTVAHASAAWCLCAHRVWAALPTAACCCVEGPATANQPFPRQECRGLSAQIALAQLHWSLHRLGPGQGTGGGRMRDAIRSLLPQGNLDPSPISAAYPYFCSGGVWHMKDRKGTASPSVTCFCLFRVFLSAKPVVYSCPLLESSDLPVDHVPAEGARREPEQDVHLQRLKGVPFSVTPWSPAPRFRWPS